MSQQEASKQQSPAPKRSPVSSQMTPIFPKDAGKRAVPVVVASTTSVPLPEEAVTMAGATTETTDVDTPTVTATSVVVPSTVVAPPPRGPGHHVQFKLDFNMLVQKDDKRKKPNTLGTRRRSEDPLDVFVTGTRSVEGQKAMNAEQKRKARAALLKQLQEFKFYVTYTFVDGTELKTEPFNATYPDWSVTHDVFVDMNFLLDLYEKPIEFTIWRARKLTDRPGLEITSNSSERASSGRKSRAGGSQMTVNGIKTYAGTVSSQRHTSIMNLEKRSAQLDEYRQKYKRPSPLMDGRKTPPQPHHYDAADKTAKTPSRPSQLMEKDQTGDGLTREFNLPELLPHKVEEPVHTDSRPKTPQHPHHYDHPEKHASAAEESSSDESDNDKARTKDGMLETFEIVIPPRTPASPHHSNTADKTIFPADRRPHSRPLSGGQQAERPKTPLAPHHFDSVERTIKPATDARLPRLARTGRVPEEFKLVGKMTMDAREFFLGKRELSVSLKDPIPGCTGASVKVSLNRNLLSASQREKLNPMSIVLVGTECMPDNPSSYEKLRETYQPVYIKYNIYDYGVRQTSCLDHARKLTWNAGSVVLTGILDPLVLKNNLSRVRVDFEIHDRDKKGGFTSNPEGGETFHEDDFSTFGVASIHLGKLVTEPEKTQLKFTVPILPGSTGSGSIPPAQWLQSKSSLKVHVKLAYPLLFPASDGDATAAIAEDEEQGAAFDNEDALVELDRHANRSNSKGPYTRIIIRMKADHIIAHLPSLLDAIRDINMNTLDFDPEYEMDRILFADYKLSPGQRHGVTNIITGCHITDGEWSLLFVEGPYEHTIKPFLASEAVLSAGKDLTVLAPEALGLKMKYSGRLWMQLQAKIYHVQLHEPVSVLLCKSATYAKSKQLKGAFEGLIIVRELTAETITYDRVERDHLFPTLATLEALASKLGQRLYEPLTELLRTIGVRVATARQQQDEQEREIRSRLNAKRDRKAAQKVDARNPEFDLYLKLAQFREPNFIELNRKAYECATNTTTGIAQKREEPLPPVYGYSNQKLNSAELKKKQLYSVLHETYPLSVFHLGKLTVSIVDAAAESKREELERRSKWMDATGFLPSTKRSP